MEEEQEDNNLLRPSSSGDAEQGNSQGFTPAMEPEPIRILQLSQSFFVADTVEEDESMIPPTQEMLIPNTQPLADISDKEGNISNGNNDTTLSNLDETYMERLVKDVKQDDKRDDDDFLEFLESQNDMTQDIPELEETQQLLSTRAELASYTSKDLDFKTVEDDEDDDWQLKFSETQETQELLSTAKMQLQEPDDIVAQLSAVFEEEKKSAKESEQENKDIFDISEDIVQKQEEEEESENEIEPSQSCLRDDTYSAFRDQLTQIAQEARTSHSTPDCSMNGGPKTVKLDSKPFCGTFTNCPSKEVSKEEDIPILVLDTEPEQLPELSVAPEISKENKTTVVCDTIDLLSSVDTTNEDLKSEDAPELEKQTEETTEKYMDSKKKNQQLMRKN
ncbi:TP53-binding protein 1 [Caerostris extrusa]|uniref:TP53-binding protein 1 n=1 Tax=Caerostris extrusa TaxID=172846 RepID=A0AAV4UVY1_CAEEX|nr:TP53-binding protein 1 [Caerostris extrusa]